MNRFLVTFMTNCRNLSPEVILIQMYYPPFQSTCNLLTSAVSQLGFPILEEVSCSVCQEASKGNKTKQNKTPNNNKQKTQILEQLSHTAEIPVLFCPSFLFLFSRTSLRWITIFSLSWNSLYLPYGRRHKFSQTSYFWPRESHMLEDSHFHFDSVSISPATHSFPTCSFKKTALTGKASLQSPYILALGMVIYTLATLPAKIFIVCWCVFLFI